MEVLDAKYRDYFSVDPKYLSHINLAAINNDPDLWKRFFPHETFVRLIRTTIDVLSRKQRLSVWVEGSYGTGKSHAVLTLKKLLDASEDETRKYFEKYPKQLSTDLFNNLQRQKSEKKILTVHRYGSSNIEGDDELVIAMYRSIVEALQDNGLNATNTSLKNCVLSWLSDDDEKDYCDRKIKKAPYSSDFNELGVYDVNDLVEKLNTIDGKRLEKLLRAVVKLGNGVGYNKLMLQVEDFIKWIKQVIKENDLKAIVFIWDEFTEYFEHNKALTGFQQIADLSETDPFYLFIVAHRSTGLFSNKEKGEKLLGRFVTPTCNIMLPEDMAFRLMGQALKENQSSGDQWKNLQEDLYNRTIDSRDLVQKRVKITDDELKGVLPIHPYTALLLKHIFSAFESNQRSMFKFIKDDCDSEMKGFQWFIDNYGPFDENPLLTIDLLWDYFYDNEEESAPLDVGLILNQYNEKKDSLEDDEKRVLKTVLLFQAVSQRIRDVDLLVPNEKNLNNAFDGTDLGNRAAEKIADRLCKNDILYCRKIKRIKKGDEKGVEKRYSIVSNVYNLSDLNKFKDLYINMSTSKLIKLGTLDEMILPLDGALGLRYDRAFVSSVDLEKIAREKQVQVESKTWKIGAIVALAKDDNEAAAIAEKINDLIGKNGESYKKVVFIDASSTQLGQKFDDYVETMAKSGYFRDKDDNLANKYEENANVVLKDWGDRINKGTFRIRYYDTVTGKFNESVLTSADNVCKKLTEIDSDLFEYGLETGPSVSKGMWLRADLKLGAECGITVNLARKYKAGSPKEHLDNYIGNEVWKESQKSKYKYWEDKPDCWISKVKLKVLSVVDEGFAKRGKVAISQIYEALEKAPFGFLPCSLSSFVMGFVLKEYADGTYSYVSSTKGKDSEESPSSVLTSEKLAGMIEQEIKNQHNPSNSYKEEYIVKLTKNEKSFNDASATIFGISPAGCTNIEKTRVNIRKQITERGFPLWCLMYALNESTTSSTNSGKADIENVIGLYLGILNDANGPEGMTTRDMALEVGRLFLQRPELVANLESICKVQQRYVDGIKAYCKEFDNGALVKLAEEIGDKGQYVNVLKEKFLNTEAAAWAWGQDRANEIIREVELEYSIIAASNEVNVNNKTKSFADCKREWLDKCKYIRLSYEAVENDLEDGKEFFKMLYNMCKPNGMLNFDKQKFYDLLTANMQAIGNFFDGHDVQIALFKKFGAFYIHNNSFTDADVEKIFNNLPFGCWTMLKSQYRNLVKNTCGEFKAKSSTVKLRQLWLDRTGTESPREWSAKHKMPILCIIDTDEYLHAKDAFYVIGQKNPDINSVNDAIEFLKSATFYDKLNSEKACDDAFREKIIKSYDVLLTDISEVKNYLSKNMGAEAYDWIDLRDKVEEKLGEIARAKYEEGGCDKALEKIDSMDANTVKNRLKELVKRDITVGMKILR